MGIDIKITNKLDNNCVQVEVNSNKGGQSKYFKVPVDKADSFIANYKKNDKNTSFITNTAFVSSIFGGVLLSSLATKKFIKSMEQLKKEGLWFACADMGENDHFDTNLKGPIGLVIGSEGEGVSRLVKENCDFTASIPMYGKISSLNASVAAALLMYEVVRQRNYSK